MQNQKPVEKLLSTPMNRRDFLRFMGAASLTAVGVTGMMHGLRGLADRHVGVVGSYGASSYGGASEPTRHGR
jgi:hypothetical protein